MLNIETIRCREGEVLVQRLPRPEYTQSKLIILPQNQMYKNPICQVIKSGPEKILKDGKVIESELKPGDRIWLLAYDGNELDPVDHPGLLMVEQELVACKLGEGEAGYV